MSDMSMSPDRTGVVLGYRRWRLVCNPDVPAERSLRASSYIETYIRTHTGVAAGWHIDGPTQAVCATPTDSYPSCPHPPGWRCHCGLYAYHDLSYEDVTAFNHSHIVVYGAAIAWGRIIYHADHSFFRAQNMLPVAFVEIPPFPGDPPGDPPGDQYVQACEKLQHISEALAAPIFDDLLDLQSYAKAERERW